MSAYDAYTDLLLEQTYGEPEERPTEADIDEDACWDEFDN